MAVGRADHTATLLADGRVLVAGGRDPGDDPLVTAELFDPETGSWSAAADMPTGHEGHTATPLPDGRVLVVGDEGSELYDPGTNSWRSTDPVTSPSTATLLADGRVLVTSSRAPNAQLYDPADDSWSNAGLMVQTPGFNHVATLLPDGSVLVAGGEVPPGAALGMTELYDPVTDCWIATGDSAVPPRSHTATLLPDGEVLDVGWAVGDVPFGELYDPDSGTWSSIELPVRLPYSAATAPLLHDGSVLFIGVDGSTALYDWARASWATGSPMTQGRVEPTVTVLTSGDVLVAGGVDGRLESPQSMPGLSSTELYHFGSGQ